jgi:nucleoside kinase
VSVLCVGYPTLDHIAPVIAGQGREQTRYITRHWLEPTPGGCACNVAVGLARLGHQAAVQFTLGNDPLSDKFIGQLKAEGVDTTRISRQTGASVPKIYMFISEQASEVFFDPAGIEDRPQTLNFSGVSHLLITVAPPASTLSYFDQADQAGVRTIWQLKLDLQAITRDTLTACVGRTDLLFCNEREYEHLRHILAEAELERLLEGRLGAVVITRGPQGSEVVTRTERIQTPIVPVEVLDTTGAGDAYTAGFLHGLLQGKPLETCARFGAKAASMVVRHWGSQTGLPTPEALT